MKTNYNVPDVSGLSGEDYPNVAKVTVDADYWNRQDPRELIWGFFCLEVIRRNHCFSNTAAQLLEVYRAPV